VKIIFTLRNAYFNIVNKENIFEMKKILLLLVVLLSIACSQNKFYIELTKLRKNKLKAHNIYKTHLNKCYKYIKNSDEIIFYNHSYGNSYNGQEEIFNLIYDIKNKTYYLGWIDHDNKSNFEIANNLKDTILKNNINLFLKKEFAQLKENVVNREKGMSTSSFGHIYYYINTDSTSKSYKFKIN